MLLGDPYAGHRKWWRPEWKPKPSRDTQWTPWDYRLAYAVQIIDDFTDGESGQFIPWDQSDNVYWEVQKHQSGYLAAVEKHNNEDKKQEPGVRVGAYPIFKEGAPRPTITSYLKEMEEDRVGVPSSDEPVGMAPSFEQLQALRRLKNADAVD